MNVAVKWRLVRHGYDIVLLSVVTRGWRNMVLVLANLPFALVGGVLAVFATGGCCRSAPWWAS